MISHHRISNAFVDRMAVTEDRLTCRRPPAPVCGHDFFTAAARPPGVVQLPLFALEEVGT